MSRSSLRIGVIAPPWLPVPPPAYGGTEGVLDSFARGLTVAGHDVRLWTTGQSTCPVTSGWTLHSVDREQMGNGAVELRHVIDGYDWLAAQGCDVIHDHTLSGPLVSRPTDSPPVITTNHGPFSNVELATIFRRSQRFAQIVAISEDQARAGRRAGVRVDRVIHHGIDPEQFTPGSGDGDDDGPFLLFLGRMAPDKGVAQAARAAIDAGVRLVIAAKVTEPLEVAYWEREVSPLCDGERVRFIGEISGPDKIRLLGQAAALINPIRWPEPFGMVMIEALACGTPVLASRCGAAPEIVEDAVTGFLCDGHDALVDRIGRLDLIDRRSCRRAAVERFSSARMVENHVELYRSLLGEPVVLPAVGSVSSRLSR